MALILTEEQRRLLRAADESGPIEVIDPTDNASYVLIRTDAFARLAAQADPYPPRDGTDDNFLLAAR